MVDYIVRAAFAEETNDGWVWICGPSTKHLDSRTVVLIKAPGHCRGIYAEVRTIDDNFLLKYNACPRIDIDCKHDTLVMAEWYRRALAIRGTTKEDDKTNTVSLIVKKAKIWGWRSLRAASHHPDLVVRLGTRLGVLGAWLGLLGVWLGLLGVCAKSSTNTANSTIEQPLSLLGVCTVVSSGQEIGLVALGLLGILGVWSGWGPPRPRLN